MIDTAGKVYQLAPFETNTNGVKGHNAQTVHICYIGGVEKLAGGKFRAKDTRTPAQKKAIIDSIHTVQCWLKKAKVDTSKVIIKGHRDYSPDKNLNGMVDRNERIKECPSFDAIPEYKAYQK